MALPDHVPTPGFSTRLKDAARSCLPLRLRQQVVRWMGTHDWIPRRSWWQMELLRDYAAREPEAFHRFLWSNHLAYAESYEVALRFGRDMLHPSRRLLLDDLAAYLERAGGVPSGGVASVLDVGCSLGYVLRFLETEVLPSATVLDGFDVDRHAIQQGQAYLGQVGSKVHIQVGDLADLEALLRGRTYDLVLVAGVLLYLSQASATAVVRQLLGHTGVVLAMAGLAHPDQDNAALARSETRAADGTFIHNIDAMATAAGGEVVYRRWEGARDVGGNTIYFVFARSRAPVR